MFGVQKFQSYLYGHHFTLQTDHKPLLTLFNEDKAIPPQASGRIQHWALTLASFEYSIICRNTSQHANADALNPFPLPDTTVETSLSGELVLMMERLHLSRPHRLPNGLAGSHVCHKCCSIYALIGRKGQTMICDPFGLGDWSSPYTMVVCCWVTEWWFPHWAENWFW